jgi:transposase
MKAYSVDLRQKIVEAVSTGTPKAQVARSFGVGLSTVKRYAGRAERGEGLTPRKSPGKGRKVDETAERLLERDLEERPTATLPQRCELLARVAGVEVSDSTVWRTLRRMGFSRKKDRWVRQNERSS